MIPHRKEKLRNLSLRWDRAAETSDHEACLGCGIKRWTAPTLNFCGAEACERERLALTYALHHTDVPTISPNWWWSAELGRWRWVEPMAVTSWSQCIAVINASAQCLSGDGSNMKLEIEWEKEGCGWVGRWRLGGDYSAMGALVVAPQGGLQGGWAWAIDGVAKSDRCIASAKKAKREAKRVARALIR